MAGYGTWSDASGFDGCAWLGLRVGHRFPPLDGNGRFQLGFRSGWETCLAEHEEIGRVDLVHIQATVLFGVRAARPLLVYWAAGVGELLGDSTPSRDDQVVPRFSVHGGPGLTWSLGRRVLLDASVTGLLFEDFGFGASPSGGTRFGVVPNLLVALQL